MRKKDIVNVRLSDVDIEILRCLSKVEFFCDYHLAILIGENKDFIKGRLKQLAKAGLVKRKMMVGDKPAVNWITVQGMKEAGIEIRSVREPELYRYEHALGCADVYVWLCLKRKKADGTRRSVVSFGEIVTERDFNSVREMIEVGTKRNGQPIYVGADRGLHKPDGFFKKSDGFYAIEFERTPKSKKAILERNVSENMKRFTKQYWFYGMPVVGKHLQDLQERYGREKIQTFSIETIRAQLNQYLKLIPEQISKKSGVERESLLGNIAEPVPLNRIPTIGAGREVELEYRRNSVVKPQDDASDQPLQKNRRIVLERRE